MIFDYSVLNLTLHEGQNQESPSPCSLNIIPLHFGHGLTSSLKMFHNFLYFTEL
jgi:hypothetical protein